VLRNDPPSGKAQHKFGVPSPAEFDARGVNAAK
jgi:hypothetical protein